MSDLKNIEIFLVPLQNLGTWCGGGTPSKQVPAYWENGTIPWVSPKDMKVEYIRGAEDTITEKAVRESATNLLPAGSVLVVTRSGILRHTFPVAVTDVPVTINQDLKALVPSAGVDPKYVAFGLRAFSREILHQCSKQGTTVNSIETKELLRFQIPLFSPELQIRIVAEIEKQFSRLDEAVANLKRVKANLKRYKAAVLKAAVEGKLTEEWRKQHPDVEPADKLLERTLAERRKAVGKGKYKETVGPDTSGLPGLPAGWVWATVELLASDQPRSIQSGPFGSNLRHSEFKEEGKLVIGIDNVQDGFFSLGANHRISEKKYRELEKYAARPGDVLITVMATVGRTCVVPEDIEPAIITKHVYRISPDRRLILPEFFHLCLWGGGVVRQQMFGKVQGQTRPGLNGSIIKALPIPIPPISEQRQILEIVEKDLSIIDRLIPGCTSSGKRADRLRQSILNQAFSGQLVPQNPNDEPAGVLLERIRAKASVGAVSKMERTRSKGRRLA